MTNKKKYYILGVDTLVNEEAYDNPRQRGLQAYSVIAVTDEGAYEVDRAYRTVREALEAWPEAIPPRQ